MMTSRSEMEFHELAGFFPLMEDDELAELVADIRENGLLEPIVTFDGKILDGRNRYNACRQAEQEPRFTEYRGEHPATYVIAKNIHRRHLTPTQQGVILLDLKPLIQAEMGAQTRDGAGRFQPAISGESGGGEWGDRLARGTGTSRTTLTRVDRVSREAPDLMPKLRTGEMTAKAAEGEVRSRKARESLARSDARAARKKRQDDPREVGVYLDACRDFRPAAREAVEVAAYGKFSPEAQKFVRRWHDDIRALFLKIEGAFDA
jgi:hypothetical protein